MTSSVSEGQWDEGSSNFTNNHCFVNGAVSYYNCKCNISCPQDSGTTGKATSCGTPCPVMAGNHYYMGNQTGYIVCGQTLAQVQAGGMEVGSVVLPIPSADQIVSLAMRQLGAHEGLAGDAERS